MPERPPPSPDAPALTVDELAAEQAAELPDREALSLIDPSGLPSGLSGGGLPADPGAGGTPTTSPGTESGLMDPSLTSNPFADKLVAVTPTTS